MKFAVGALCLLACLGTAEASVTKSPVERVVKLLTDLKEKLTADEAVEQKVYDKYACWCETTSARKAGAITAATNDLRSLGQTILSLKGFVATRTAEIEELTEDIKQNIKEQEEATSIRGKENAAYMAESTETKQALAAMEQAITVLVKATTLVQTKSTPKATLLQAHTQATAAIKHVVDVMPTSRNLKEEDMSQISEFMQTKDTSKYAPQSASIQGILKDMYETMATDLETANSDEAQQNLQFEGLIYEKQVQQKEDEESKAKKEGEKAEAELRLADTQAIYDDTLENKKADIVFFDATKDACSAKSEEWEVRSSLRADEISGVAKALEILTSDDARALFASAIQPGMKSGASFLQIDESSPALQAYAALKKLSSKTHNLRLAALAVSVRTAKAGHFDKVISAIDDMVKVLADEGADDIAKRDQCKDEYQKSASTIADVNWKIEKNQAKIDKLQSLIELRTEQRTKTIEEIDSVTQQMKEMKAQREAENEAFHAAKDEDEAAIVLLTQAKEALAKFYKENKIDVGALVQKEPEFAVSEDQAPEASFSGKGKRGGESKGIVSILTMIIEDLEDEIKNSQKEEASTQVEYEKMMKAASELKEDLIAKKISLEGAISKRGQEKADENADMDANNLDKKDEEDWKAEITPDCDWIMGAFSGRAAARKSEMEGLTAAKALLAGQKPADALLQKVNDHTLSTVKFLAMRA
jgi:hypothetical protein